MKGHKDKSGKFHPHEKKNGVNSNLHKLEIPESQKDNPIWIEMQQRLAREEKVKCEQCNKEVTKNDLTRHGICDECEIHNWKSEHENDTTSRRADQYIREGVDEDTAFRDARNETAWRRKN